MVDYLSENTVNISSGALSDSLVFTTTVDCYISINLSGTSGGHLVRAGTNATVGQNRIIARSANPLYAGAQSDLACHGYFPAGTKIFVTKAATTVNTLFWYPLKTS